MCSRSSSSSIGGILSKDKASKLTDEQQRVLDKAHGSRCKTGACGDQQCSQCYPRTDRKATTPVQLKCERVSDLDWKGRKVVRVFSSIEDGPRAPKAGRLIKDFSAALPFIFTAATSVSASPSAY